MLIGGPRGCEAPKKGKFIKKVIRSIDRREEEEEKVGSEGDESGEEEGRG
jgi:hypothetical protein